LSARAVAIGLKIPDNAAYTALTTLRRLGIEVARVERSEIVHVPEGGTAAQIADRVQRDEALFNPNKHRITVLEDDAPRKGEVWIVQDDGSRTVGWRLTNASGEPVSKDVLALACERLLCNPAVERAMFPR
jgi:phosphoribosylformylglycinamidine (FGAM) synthase PurS component